MKIAKRLAAVAAGIMSIALVIACVPVIAGAQATTTTVVPVSVGSDLGQLFVLGQLFGGSGLWGTGGVSLGDTLMLSQIFNGTTAIPVGGASGPNLGDLFTLNALFNNGYGNGILQPNSTSLGNMLILGSVFR